MPNNCSTLIQRKQHILNQILRSNSEGKLQDDIIETTAELRVGGTRKLSAYPCSSTYHLTGIPAARQSNVPPTNRLQPSPTSPYDAHLPTIQYTRGNTERHNQFHDEYHSRARSKTPTANASPKSSGCTPSASISSIYNALAKRSTENLMSANGNYEEINNSSPIPLSRRSQRPTKDNATNHNTTKQTIIPQKQLTDSGIDIRFSSSSGDTNQQQRALKASTQHRTNISQAYMESPRVHETTTRDRVKPGQLYQRRANNAIKAPTKQKIDKYRRRSEERIQAVHGHTSMNLASNGLSGTHHSPAAHPKPPPSTPATSQRVLSDADIQARVESVRLSDNSNLPHMNEPVQSYSHQYSRNRVKSPYSYPTHQQIAPTIPASSPPTPLVHYHRNHEHKQPILSMNSSPHHLTNATDNRRPVPPTTPQKSIRQSTNFNSKDLYLAFIASRRLSTLEDTLLECDADRRKVIRIFTWLQDVEQHRHEQSNYELLLTQQDQPTPDHDDDFSLYSEIQYAVDDLPANTSGKPCERIPTMEFED